MYNKKRNVCYEKPYMEFKIVCSNFCYYYYFSWPWGPSPTILSSLSGWHLWTRWNILFPIEQQTFPDGSDGLKNLQKHQVLAPCGERTKSAQIRDLMGSATVAEMASGRDLQWDNTESQVPFEPFSWPQAPSLFVLASRICWLQSLCFLLHHPCLWFMATAKDKRNILMSSPFLWKQWPASCTFGIFLTIFSCICS